MQSKLNIVLDIETVIHPVTQADVDEYMREEYQGAPSNWKDPVKIAEHRAQAERDAVDTIAKGRRFKIDGARVVCVGLGLVPFNDEVQAEAHFSDDENELAKFLVDTLKGYGAFYRLVGYNIRGFDIPHIARICYRAGLRLPNLPGKWDIIDMCKDGPLRDQQMSMKRAAKAFGIALDVPDVDGSSVAKLYADGEHQKIVDYCKSDVVAEGKLYQALSSVHTF